MYDAGDCMPVATNRTRLRRDMRALGSTEEEIDRMISFLPPLPKRPKKTNSARGKGKTLAWLLDHVGHQGNECLIWPFARHADFGRGLLGSVTLGGQRWAHRLMCKMAHGAAPTPQHQAAHSCGNGHEGCVHPLHLSWKTNSQNQIERYRVHDRPNPNPGGSTRGRFTLDEIAGIRSKYGEYTQMQLAEMYQCSLGTVQYYLKYRVQRGHEPRSAAPTLS